MSHDISNPPEGTIINRHWNYKTAGKIGLSAGGAGVNVAQVVTGYGSLTVLAAAAAGTVVAATGVGLVITAGVLTVASSGIAGRSAYKTYQHRKNLQSIYAERNTYACTSQDPAGKNILHHKVVAEDVLPYIINKKTAKLGRKAASVVPGVGLLEGIRAIGKKGYKSLRGTLGVNRENAAKWLANHLLSHDCELTEAIVTDLYSEQEMLWLKYHCDGPVAVEFLMAKMKST